MHNTFGKFIIKGTFPRSPNTAWYLKTDSDKPPRTTHNSFILAEATLMWERTVNCATEFPSTDRALPWIAFAMKNTNAVSFELIRL